MELISDVHLDVLFTTLRDPDFSNDDIHRTVSEIYLKDTSRLIWKAQDRRARHRFSGHKWQLDIIFSSKFFGSMEHGHHVGVRAVRAEPLCSSIRTPHVCSTQ